jgi:hypothetical protein
MASSSSQPATPALHFDKGDSVTLIVGPEKQELLVHANYIARNSAFFKTALKKEWREGQTRTISMPTEDYETLTTYLRFVYGFQLPSEFDVNQVSALQDPTADQLEQVQAAYVSFAKLYILGCRLMDNKFKEAVIAKIFDLFHGCSSRQRGDSDFNPGPEPVDLIYGETLELDPARRLLVDMHMKYPQDLNSQYDAGFLLDLAQGFSKTVRNKLSPGNTILELRSYML